MFASGSPSASSSAAAFALSGVLVSAASFGVEASPRPSGLCPLLSALDVLREICHQSSFHPSVLLTWSMFFRSASSAAKASCAVGVALLWRKSDDAM